YYESVLTAYAKRDGSGTSVAKAAANWTITELGRLANEAHVEVEASPVTPEHLAELLSLLNKSVIGTPQAKTAVEEMFKTGKSAAAVVEELGLAQITDSGAIGEAVAKAIADNPQAIND